MNKKLNQQEEIFTDKDVIIPLIMQNEFIGGLNKLFDNFAFGYSVSGDYESYYKTIKVIRQLMTKTVESLLGTKIPVDQIKNWHKSMMMNTSYLITSLTIYVEFYYNNKDSFVNVINLWIENLKKEGKPNNFEKVSNDFSNYKVNMIEYKKESFEKDVFDIPVKDLIMNLRNALSHRNYTIYKNKVKFWNRKTTSKKIEFNTIEEINTRIEEYIKIKHVDIPVKNLNKKRRDYSIKNIRINKNSDKENKYSAILHNVYENNAEHSFECIISIAELLKFTGLLIQYILTYFVCLNEIQKEEKDEI